MRDTSATRRTLLAGIAGITALAGCSSTSDSAPATDAGDSGTVIQDASVEGFTLAVSLRESATIERVNVIAPDGSEFASTEVVSGQTRVEFDIGAEYQPGEYEVTAEPSGQTTLEIRPEIEFTGFGIGANHMDMMPEGMGTVRDVEAWVQLANRGTGPAVITNLAFEGGVPNPSTEILDSQRTTGIFDTERGRGEKEGVRLSPGDDVLLFSNTLPFTFEGEGVDCEESSLETDFSIVIGFSGPPRQKKATLTARYSGADSYHGCSVEASSI